MAENINSGKGIKEPTLFVSLLEDDSLDENTRVTLINNLNIDDVAKDKKDFIKLCVSLYKETSDYKLKDAAIFALMNIRDFEAVKTIILDDTVDEELKVACVSRNSKTFIDVINNYPTKEDVEFILDCMEIALLKELAAPMKNKLLNRHEFDSNRLRNMISFMEFSGVESDTSRFNGKPTSNWIE